MAVVVNDSCGVVLDQSIQKILVIDSGEDFEPRHTIYEMKKDFFEVHSPFYMDSQAERIKVESQDVKSADDEAVHRRETSAQRKRRKKKPPLLPEEELKVIELIERVLPLLVIKAKECTIFLEGRDDSLFLHGNNEMYRSSALHQGCGDNFSVLCVATLDNMDSSVDDLFVVDKDLLAKNHQWSTFINKMVVHSGEAGVSLRIENHCFFIPPSSSFLMSSFASLVSGLYESLKVPERYDLIVMDPPWTNKSVKRKKSYNTFEESELSSFPIHDFSKPGTLICLWVTNNERLLSFIEDVLFPSWKVQIVAKWIWMKVTKYGEPVRDLRSPHKKPYERLIIGRFGSCKEYSDTYTNDTKVPFSDLKESEFFTTNKIGQTRLCQNYEDGREQSESDERDLIGKGEINESRLVLQVPIPKHFVLVSTPCSLHSKKPPLSDVFAPYLPSNPKCLEMFARNLLPGWTSWGNEVLRHQHVDLFDVT